MSWGGALLMVLSMLLWFALLAAVIVAVARWLFSQRPDASLTTSGPTGLHILEQRYARGEIDEATFDQMRARLLRSTLSSDPTDDST